MTWTCTKCLRNVDEASILCVCGADKPSRAQLEAENAKLRDALKRWDAVTVQLGRLGMMGDGAREPSGVAVAALERQAKRVQQVEGIMRDLECQRDGHQHAHGALAERFENLRERARGLEAQLAQAQKPVITGNPYADAENHREQLRREKAKSMMAQKPAAPVGLPAVGEGIRVISPACARESSVAALCMLGSEKGFRLVDGGFFLVSDEGKSWERIPAQASREPRPLELSADGKRMDGESAAPPPGEVSTNNVAAWYADDYQYTYTQLQDAAMRDIRAAVAAERARWEALREAAVNFHRGLRIRAEHDRDAALAEVSRLKQSLDISRDSASGLAKQAAVSLTEIEGLRAKLEASEKLSARRRLQIFDLNMAAEKNLSKWKAVAQRQEGDLNVLRERRQTVDRERAIKKLKRLLNRFGVGLQERDLAVIVDAILGAAKADMSESRGAS